MGNPEWTDDRPPSPGWQPISRVCNYLNWAHTTRPVILLSSSRFRRYEKTLLHPSHSFVLRTSYLLYPGPVIHSIPPSTPFRSKPTLLSRLLRSLPLESSSLSPIRLCSKPHLVSILRFQDDCIASYTHSAAPIHRRTSLIILDISRYPRIIDPRHQTTLISLSPHLSQQPTT